MHLWRSHICTTPKYCEQLAQTIPPTNPHHQQRPAAQCCGHDRQVLAVSARPPHKSSFHSCSTEKVRTWGHAAENRPNSLVQSCTGAKLPTSSMEWREASLEWRAASCPPGRRSQHRPRYAHSSSAWRCCWVLEIAFLNCNYDWLMCICLPLFVSQLFFVSSTSTFKIKSKGKSESQSKNN